MQQGERFPRILYSSLIDVKDDMEEKFDKARVVLQRVIGNGSESKAHDALQTAACRDKVTHDDICVGLVANILTDPAAAPKCYRDLILVTRDTAGVAVDHLVLLAADKYHKLTDTCRNQLIWVVKELVKAGINGADILCWNLMRQVAGGDISNRNLWLAEHMLEMYIDNRPWLEKHPVLVASVIFTYLRILEDHFPPNLASLKQKEVNFVVSLIRENFNAVCLNPNLGMGRDFVRLLQGVSRIPEIQTLWNDIYFNPKTLSPHFTGLIQLLNVRTSRKYLQSRLTPEMEKKIIFLASYVRFGMHKRYQEWFQRQFLATPESQTLRADIIRFIVGVIHPSNEILSSDVLPRWAIIGWLLTTCTNPVAAANAKLALFFDWLVFDAIKDNIMNIEPGILVMYHSIKPHLAITATLLDFLIRLINEFWPQGSDKVKDGLGAAFRTIVDKKVLQSLGPVLENPKLEPELRISIQENLLPLMERNRENSDPLFPGNNGHGGSLMSMTGNADGPEPLSLNYSLTPSVQAPIPSASNDIISPYIKAEHPTIEIDADFSDDEEDDEVEQEEPLTRLTNSVAMRSSPTLTNNVEEEERSKIFETVQTLPTTIRMALDRMLSDSLCDKNENLEEIIEECGYQTLEKDQREALSKSLIYIFKSELKQPCVDEKTNLIDENLFKSPLMAILDILLQLKPSDKGHKSKNLFRLLSDIVTALPTTSYKILLMLGQLRESPDGPANKEDYYPTLYKNLCTNYRTLKLDLALHQDIKACWETELMAVGFLCPILYEWYPTETVGSMEMLRLIVSTLDASQLQDIVWRIAQGDFNMVDNTDLVSTIGKTLDWETWEQHCVWTILATHQFDIDDYLAIIPTLDYRNNAEALTSLFLILKNEKPSDKVLGPCLCRKPIPNDRFVMSLLMSWSENHEEVLADVLTSLLVRAYGSPVKRKRGGASGGRGTASPAGPATPNVDNVLAHLDLLRIRIQGSEELGIFSTDSIQAALLQVQSWVTETQKSKYKDLLALAATEEATDTKDQRSKRTATGRKLPSSPTGGGGGGGGGGSGNSLSRTRSGRTRQLIKDGSETSSDEEDEIIPRSRTPKKRRKTAFSDSD